MWRIPIPLRDLLNEALASVEYSGASIQQPVMQVLDTNPGTGLGPPSFHRHLENVGTELRIRLDQSRLHSRSRMAGILVRYMNEFEVLLGVT